MTLIKGTTVTLYEKTATGADAFGVPTYSTTPVAVDNVLVGQPSAEELTSELNLTGRRIAYVLGIPKGDAHQWENRLVSFFGETFQTFGAIEQGIEENVPGPWHKKIKCERSS